MIHNDGGVLHHEGQEQGRLGGDIVERSHGSGRGQPRRDARARPFEPEGGAGLRLPVDLPVFTHEVPCALHWLAEAPQIGAHCGAGAFALGFGETGITGRCLEGPSRLVQGEREGFHRLAPRAEHRHAGTLFHGGWQALFLQEIAEARALSARQKNRLRLLVRPLEEHQGDFVEVIARGLQPGKQRVHARGPAAEPRAQLRVLLRGLAQRSLCVFQGVRRVRQNRKHHGGCGSAIEQRDRAARRGGGRMRAETRAAAAPGNIVQDRSALQARTAHGLVARMQHLLLVVLRHAHFALEHGNARSLDAGVYAEHRSGDGHAAIGGGHIKMARAPLGGLHDDAAAVHVDRNVLPALRTRQRGAFAKLDGGAVPQLQGSVGILGGADLHAAGQILAGGQGPYARAGNLVQGAIHRLHESPAGAPTILIHGEPDRDAGRRHHHGRRGPADRIRPGRRRQTRRERRYLAFVNPAAGHALVKMVLQQDRPRIRQTARAVFGNERLEIGAVANMRGELRAGNPVNAAGLFRDARPDPGGGGFGHRGIDGFVANLQHGSLQCGIHGIHFGGHATPPTYER